MIPAALSRHPATATFFGLLTILSLPAAAQTSSARTPADSLIEQGQKLNAAGDQPGALALYQQALRADPGSFDAQVASGIALDLEGQYRAARSELKKAITAAPNDSIRARALRTMAISYAFTRNANDAARYEERVIDSDLAKQDWLGAADVDDELARIFLESGELDSAHYWYRAGHETALRKTDLTAAARDLWDFRWEHAQARIAARRGQREAAAQHVAAAKVIIDRGTNPDQVRFFPYLEGYVALYLGDAQTAVGDLQKADQHDPFILYLTARAYEKMGDKARAEDYYRRVLAINTHNPPNAFARPAAKQKVAA